MSRAAALLLAAALTAGCGTTVQQSAFGDAATSGFTGSGDGLGTPVEGRPPTGSGPIGTSGTSPTGGSLSGRSGTEGAREATRGAPSTGAIGTTGDTNGSGTNGGVAGPGGNTSRGVTGGQVTIGILTLRNVAQAAAAIGLGDLTPGDGTAQGRAIVNDINKVGGIGGRKVVPVFVELDPTRNQNNPELNWQEACTALTQDKKVFAVVTATAASPTLADCLSKKGVLLLAAGTLYTQQIQDRNRGFYYGPGTYLADRIYLNLVDELVASGFLTKESKVGLLTFDRPETRDLLSKVVEPALARHGISVAARGYEPPDSSGPAASSSFVLQFRNNDVDRVIPVISNPLFFMQAAENQQYRPRYALTSIAGPAVLQGVAANQLQGAVGIGWQYYYDVDAGRRPKTVNAATSSCLATMKAAGQASEGAGPLASQLQLCDGFYFLRQALAGQSTLTPSILAQRTQRLGTSYVSPATFRTDFSGGRTDGAAAYRPLAFKSDCSCFAYTGGDKAG